jgi:hypothetical protein
MVKTVITPKQTDVHLSIPENYVGKQVEITFFVLDELVEKHPQKTLGDFFGRLPEKEYLQLKECTQHARKEWNRNF